MGRVIVDAETLAKLKGLDQPMEFYDEHGKLLAYCMPADSGLDSLPALQGPNPFTDGEIREAMKDSDPGRPLAEILAELRRQ